MPQLNSNSCVEILIYRRKVSVLNLLTGIIFSLLLTSNGLAQTKTTNSFLLGTVQLQEMSQRVLQYEILLGREITSNIGLCIDGELSYAWMLPEKADTEISFKAIERVKSVQRFCEDRSVRDSNVSGLTGSLTGGMRTVMVDQFQTAQVLEQNKKSTRSCLSNAQSQDVYKACIQLALPVVPSDFQWARWFSLFERRATLFALNQVEKKPSQMPTTRDVQPP